MCQIGEPGWPDGRWVMTDKLAGLGGPTFRISAKGPQGSGKTTALNLIEDALHSAGYVTSTLDEDHTMVVRAPRPLPAPALTEDAIVAALKADPAMAGRVIVCFADTMWAEDRLTVSTAAKQECVSRGAPGALQSLAVALAAASYRG